MVCSSKQAYQIINYTYTNGSKMKKTNDFPVQLERIKTGFKHFLMKNGFHKHKRDELTLYAKRSPHIDEVCRQIDLQTGIKFKAGENRDNTVQFAMFDCAKIDFNTIEIFELERMLHLFVDDNSFYTDPSENYFLAIESFHHIAIHLSESGYVLHNIQHKASHARTSVIDKVCKRGAHLIKQIRKPGVRISKEMQVAFTDSLTGELHNAGTLNDELRTCLRVVCILDCRASGKEIFEKFSLAQESEVEVTITDSLNKFFKLDRENQTLITTMWLLHSGGIAVLSKYMPEGSQGYFIKKVEKKFPNTPYSDFIRFDMVKSHAHKGPLYRLTVMDIRKLLSEPEPQAQATRGLSASI